MKDELPSLHLSSFRPSAFILSTPFACRASEARDSIGAFLEKAARRSPNTSKLPEAARGSRRLRRRLSALHLRADYPRHTRCRALTLALAACAAAFVSAAVARAQQQQTNPVDRKVENPITDTPSVSP